MSSTLIWIRGAGVLACAGPGALTRRSGQARADMGESGRAPIGVLSCGCGDMGIGAAVSDGLGGSGPFGPDVRATRDRAGCASGLPVVGDGEISPRRRGPPGTPPGLLARC